MEKIKTRTGNKIYLIKFVLIFLWFI